MYIVNLIHGVAYVEYNIKGHLLKVAVSDSQWSCFKGDYIVEDAAYSRGGQNQLV